MDDADVYKKQKFGQPISVGKSPALLIIDFVNGFLNPEMFGGGNVLQAARNTEPVLKLFRDKKAPVIFTRIVYAEDGADCGVWCEKAPRLKELTESSTHSQIADFLAPKKGEIIIRKAQASAFFDTALASVLRHRQVDTLVIAGATTSGCVRASVVDAVSHNFRPIVLVDCVGDRAIGPHQANLFDMEQKYANMAVSSELGQLFSLFQ